MAGMTRYRIEVLREIATTIEIEATNPQAAAEAASRAELPPVDNWEVLNGIDVHVYDSHNNELRHERY